MNQLDVSNFFASVTNAFLTDPDFYPHFIRHGFDPNEWPTCDSRELAREFHRLAQERGIQFAQFTLGRKAPSAPALPRDAAAVICAFEEHKKYGSFRELGLRLTQDPLRGNEILSSFKSNTTPGAKISRLREIIHTHLEDRIKLAVEKTEVEVVIPGWPILSHAIGGFNSGRVNLIVAGTGVGKTTLALNLVLGAIKKMPVLYFNMEMMLADVWDRFIMMGAEMTSHQLRQMDVPGNVDLAAGFMSKIYNYQELFMSDGRVLSLEQISAEIYKHAEEHQIKLVVVDYDQKIRSRYQADEWMAIQRAIEDLEEVAKATQTCVIVLAQGDDDNLPKASKRSMQSASTVLAFHEEEGNYIIETKKNRFGRRRVRIDVQCDFERFKIIEQGESVAKTLKFRPPTRSIYDVADKD